jgi:hypothetical protein
MAAFERLRIAIIRSAVMDLRTAIRKSNRVGYKCDEQKALEKWFLSSWGQLLSGDTGEYIIEKCRKTYKTQAHKNGKQQLPEDVQKQVVEEYHSGVKTSVICAKYGISDFMLRFYLKRWDR